MPLKNIAVLFGGFDDGLERGDFCRMQCLVGCQVFADFCPTVTNDAECHDRKRDVDENGSNNGIVADIEIDCADEAEQQKAEDAEHVIAQEVLLFAGEHIDDAFGVSGVEVFPDRPAGGAGVGGIFCGLRIPCSDDCADDDDGRTPEGSGRGELEAELKKQADGKRDESCERASKVFHGPSV